MAARDPRRSSIPPTTPEASPVRPSVLLVEDNIDNREMYTDMLCASGFDVLAAENADAALAQTSARAPSAVVTDMRMPGTRTALDLCRHFSRLHVPVIVLTGVSPGEEQDAARRAGCALVLMKPLAPDALVAHVQRLVSVPSSVRTR
jgi:CheY-like chemotaxis protein